MRMVLIGPPGSGKGTQAVRLVERFKIPHISTGEMLQAAVAERTELGKKAGAFMRSGHLVPEGLVLPMAFERLSTPDCRPGFILDGFPRTQPQAEELNAELKRQNLALDVVLVIELPDELILERNTGRRSDPVTGAIHQLKFKPPPSSVAGRLVQRQDDTTEAVAARLARYHAEADSITSFYLKECILLRVDGKLGFEEYLADFCGCNLLKIQGMEKVVSPVAHVTLVHGAGRAAIYN